MTDYQDPAVIDDILANCKRIAVVGLSPKADRASYGVSRYMLESGYDIVPVNPQATEVFGLPCYPDLAAVPGTVDLVTIFRRSEDVPPVVEDAIAKGARAVWMQQGIVNEAAGERARAAGLQVVMDACMMIEHARSRR